MNGDLVMNRRRNRWECKDLEVCIRGLKNGLYEEHIRELTKALLQAYTDFNARIKCEKILIENKNITTEPERMAS